MEQIILGGGCFWCLDALFRNVRGITGVVSGYSGGDVISPSYEEVSGGKTGHAEVVQVTFDPAEIPLLTILDIFWAVHDPTTPNRQGNDVGTQYRSAIYHTASQKDAVIKSVQRAKQIWGDNITTEIKPVETFYPAETYHQDYFNKNPDQGYCQLIINPKLQKFRKNFPKLLKSI